MVQHSVAIQFDRQLLHHHIRGYDTWNHTMSQFRIHTYVIVSCANSLRSRQSPSSSMNSPSFVNSIHHYLFNSSPPLNTQPCESNPRITARVCDRRFLHCAIVSFLQDSSTELGQWTGWISSDLNPWFPKTRPAATFVNCVCGIKLHSNFGG